MTIRWSTFKAVIRALAAHRSTYRLLGLLLVTFEVSQGGAFLESLVNVVCVVFGGCSG